jgi:hypothetical protein
MNRRALRAEHPGEGDPATLAEIAAFVDALA